MSKSKSIAPTKAATKLESAAAEVLGLPDKARLEARAQAIREMIFEAQAIVDVTAAALESEAPVRWHGIRQALDVAYDILEKAASQLAEFASPDSEVSHGQA